MKPGPKPTAQAVLDANEEAILEAIRLGSGYRAIARKHKVSLGVFGTWINANPERSQACARAREDSADECDEEAARAIREAKDQFQLAKARELAVHYRWRAKVRNPKRYGDRQQIDHGLTESLEQMLLAGQRSDAESGR